MLTLTPIDTGKRAFAAYLVSIEGNSLAKTLLYDAL
jgi:hypothetical protein